MSLFLFGAKQKKRLQKVWAVICVLVIISMVLLYAPIF